MASGLLSSFLHSRSEDARNTHQGFDRSAIKSTALRSILSPLLVGISYYAGTIVGFNLTPLGQPNSTFWPPNAILLAAFLLVPERIWWTFLVAVLPAHMLAQLQFGVPLATALGWFATNTGEALIGAFCIRRLLPGKTLFGSIRGVFIFVVFGVLVAPFATSFLDAAVVVITGWGRSYWPVGMERFWTNALAELTLVPLIVLGRSSIPAIRQASVAEWSEAGLLAVGTILASVLAFGVRPVSPAVIPALLYAPLPLLLWAAIRFGPIGLNLSLLAIASISIWYTMHGVEPFPSASMPQNILSLQILLSVVAVPLLFLSAIISEARRTQESLRNMSGSLIDAQEAESRRIARELHDDLGQRVALAQATLDGIITESDPSLKPSLTDLSGLLSTIGTAAREVSHSLYPRRLEQLGLPTALKALCDEIGNGKTLLVESAVGQIPTQLQPVVSLTLYRVAQEALHNVLKHSHANKVDVELAADDKAVLLRITDDGIGFKPASVTDGVGIASMRERVRSIGGTLDLTSSPGKGTKIEVRVDLR